MIYEQLLLLRFRRRWKEINEDKEVIFVSQFKTKSVSKYWKKKIEHRIYIPEIIKIMTFGCQKSKISWFVWDISVLWRTRNKNFRKKKWTEITLSKINTNFKTKHICYWCQVGTQIIVSKKSENLSTKFQNIKS